MTSRPHPRSASSSPRRPAPPAPLRWLTIALIFAMVLYVVLPILMAVDREATVRSILAASPSLDARELDFAVTAALVFTAVLHAASTAVAIWLVTKARRGRRWARVALSVYLVGVTGSGSLSWTAGPQFSWVVLATTAVHLAMLGLLWLPISSRRFFAAKATQHEEVRVAATR